MKVGEFHGVGISVIISDKYFGAVKGYQAVRQLSHGLKSYGVVQGSL
jgi:hypothetical protein